MPNPEASQGTAASHLVEWLRTLPALITAATALVTAIAALRKPPDDTPTRLAYQELSKVIEQLAEASKQNQQDLIALRNFLEGYLRAAEGRERALLVSQPDPLDGARQRQPGRPGAAGPPRKATEGAAPRPGGRNAGESIASPPTRGSAQSASEAQPATPGASGTGRVPLQLPKLTMPREVARPLPYKALLQRPQQVLESPPSHGTW
ncbi:MAG: hypothetical protein RMK29_01090 [Myxococcales bacterium]|nr:hypothetical protein [Myxococcota bacterium]MDW8280272.1 hypothetical protein [Myxococcales bacterium]